jgi:ABC-type multidrug transport system ATPase subunit
MPLASIPQQWEKSGLVVDEPTLGLAPMILEQLSNALDTLRNATNTIVLLAEQNATFALPHADRVYVIAHARIVWEGDPARFAEEAGAGYLQDRGPELCAFRACRAVGMTADRYRFPSGCGYPDQDLEPQMKPVDLVNFFQRRSCREHKPSLSSHRVH